METLNAIEIGEQTCLGILVKPTIDSPLAHGNCFSVLTDKKKYFKIVNFNLENLKFVLAHGVSWPVKIKPLSERHAVIHDERIPDEWYQTRFCETCCPDDLLPQPQRLRHEREIASGVRTVGNGVVCVRPSKRPELKP